MSFYILFMLANMLARSSRKQVHCYQIPRLTMFVVWLYTTSEEMAYAGWGKEAVENGDVLHICNEQQECLGDIAVIIEGPHHGIHASGDLQSEVYTAVLPAAPSWLKLPCSVLGREIAFTHVCVISPGTHGARTASI
jgi:hypothetical protein